MIRVTGGKYKGRTLKVSDSKDLRPTTSFFREWIFNVLNNMIDLNSVNVLDLFAGSGIVGIEFLSRGANSVTFIEKDRKVLKGIENFLDIIGENNFKAYQNDAQRSVSKLLDLNKFDIIFLDPPYKGDFGDEIFKALDKQFDSIKDDTLIIYESYQTTDIASSLFEPIKEKRSGTTKITILKKRLDD